MARSCTPRTGGWGRRRPRYERPDHARSGTSQCQATILIHERHRSCGRLLPQAASAPCGELVDGKRPTATLVRFEAQPQGERSHPRRPLGMAGDSLPIQLCECSPGAPEREIHAPAERNSGVDAVVRRPEAVCPDATHNVEPVSRVEVEYGIHRAPIYQGAGRGRVLRAGRRRPYTVDIGWQQPCLPLEGCRQAVHAQGKSRREAFRYREANIGSVTVGRAGGRALPRRRADIAPSTAEGDRDLAASRRRENAAHEEAYCRTGQRPER